MQQTNQKLITFCVPSYNSAAYLNVAVDSLLKGGDDVEIIIVDDGSVDETGSIADDYALRFPGIIKAVHQSNGGHGEAINHALRLAEGLYFKTVDSDDWVDESALKTVIADIKQKHGWADLYLTDYVYWQGYDQKGKTISYRYLFKHGFNVGWDQIGNMKLSTNITIHSAMFRTSVLRASNAPLPPHTSYEDNYYVYAPLFLTQKITYVPVALYQYLIGRSGQSVEEETCLRKYRDFLSVSRLVFMYADITSLRKKDKGLYRVAYHHLLLNMILAVVWTRLRNDKEAAENLKKFWVELKINNPRQYQKIYYRSLCAFLLTPGKLGNFSVKVNYRIAHAVVKFN